MPLTFPLALETFADVLGVTSATFVLNEPVMSARSAGGTIYTAANGSAMWEGSITTRIAKASDGLRVEALMDALRGAGRSFLWCDPTRAGPQNDPDGAILSHRRLAIAALGESRLKIGPQSGYPAIKGFPPELRLLPGDMIGFEYGSNPVRYALHRVAPAKAKYVHQGAGVTEWIDVLPAIRPGALVGAVASLVRPVCKAVPVPGSIQGGERVADGMLYAGWTLQWRQTLR